MVPDVTPTSYYGRPILKAPTWRWPIPAYLFTGGLAAGTAMVGAAARLSGDPRLAGRASALTLGAVGASTAFLVHDLGRPSRFHHMLRVAKPTSPMSVGTWIFSAFASLSGAAAAAEVGQKVGLLPSGLAGPLTAAAQVGAAVVAPALATYTAVLVADTAVPVWHEAHRQLPVVFAGSAAAAGAGAGMVLAALGPAGTTPAGVRRMALLGAAVETAADEVMHRHLRSVTTGDARTPDLASAYSSGTPRRLHLAARCATLAGAGAIAASRQHRLAGALGGLALMAGSALERFAVFHAGRASAADPVYTVGPQRAGLVRAGSPT